MTPFNVISKRSGKIRTVYAVSLIGLVLYEDPYFLIYRDGKWVWEESRWYEPIAQAQWQSTEHINNTAAAKIYNQLFNQEVEE